MKVAGGIAERARRQRSPAEASLSISDAVRVSRVPREREALLAERPRLLEPPGGALGLAEDGREEPVELAEPEAGQLGEGS